MTMAQGGLFNGDEGTNELLTTASNGQSQSKEAKYHRAYRSDPKNKDRINSQKKRRRALKKESELGSVSSMFESVALPGKAEPQTVEKVLNKSNKPSLSDLWGLSSWELNDSSRNYCQKDQRSVVRWMSENAIKEKSSNLDIQNQADILMELRDSFRAIHGELKMLREEVKPATLALPMDNKKEQQTFARDIAKPNSHKLPKKTAEEQAGKPNFIAGFFHQISQIDGGAFARNFPAALVLGFCAYHACLFVVEQTIPLYESLKFPNPQMACYGAVGIAVGFSALSAISRAEIIKLFTAVIIAYEVLIVWSGSQVNQKDLASEALRLNPTHFSISESYSIAKIDYEQKKARYEDKNSEVYHNGWFKSNHLDPAKKILDDTSSKLVAIESDLGKKYSTDWIHLVLKALYRLCAVALVMLLAKESIKRGVGALSPTTTTKLE